MPARASSTRRRFSSPASLRPAESIPATTNIGNIRREIDELDDPRFCVALGNDSLPASFTKNGRQLHANNEGKSLARNESTPSVLSPPDQVRGRRPSGFRRLSRNDAPPDQVRGPLTLRSAAQYKKGRPLMADQLILDPQFFLLEFVKADIVGVGAGFLFVDERLELSMLAFESLDLGLIHRSHSFRGLD